MLHGHKREQICFTILFPFLCPNHKIKIENTLWILINFINSCVHIFLKEDFYETKISMTELFDRYFRYERGGKFEFRQFPVHFWFKWHKCKICFNNRFLRERGMASNPKMEYQVFLCTFQKKSAMATLGLKEFSLFLQT